MHMLWQERLAVLNGGAPAEPDEEPPEDASKPVKQEEEEEKEATAGLNLCTSIPDEMLMKMLIND